MAEHRATLHRPQGEMLATREKGQSAQLPLVVWRAFRGLEQGSGPAPRQAAAEEVAAEARPLEQLRLR
jgi:hypothetical protein